jgi:tetratricopeptide (TPR) repeat protein
MKKYEKALMSFNKAVEIDDTVPEFWHSKGCVHGILRDFNEAMRDIDKAIALNPKFAMAWRSRGLFLQFLGKLNEAVVSYERSLALEFDPDTEATKETIRAKM